MKSVEITVRIPDFSMKAEEIRNKILGIIEDGADRAVAQTSADYAGAAFHEGSLKDFAVEKQIIPDGFAVVAHGESVPFLEFGTGVYYNPTDEYPAEYHDTLPNFMPIGTYGNHNGSKRGWWFNDDNNPENPHQYTHGIPQTMALKFAADSWEAYIREKCKS